MKIYWNLTQHIALPLGLFIFAACGQNEETPQRATITPLGGSSTEINESGFQLGEVHEITGLSDIIPAAPTAAAASARTHNLTFGTAGTTTLSLDKCWNASSEESEPSTSLWTNDTGKNVFISGTIDSAVKYNNPDNSNYPVTAKFEVKFGELSNILALRSGDHHTDGYSSSDNAENYSFFYQTFSVSGFLAPGESVNLKNYTSGPMDPVTCVKPSRLSYREIL